MGKICVIKSCTSRRKSNLQSVSYFQATSSARLQSWKRSLGIELNPKDFVCHLHFKEEDIKMKEIIFVDGEPKTFLTGKKQLQDGAIPTIHHQFNPVKNNSVIKKHILVGHQVDELMDTGYEIEYLEEPLLNEDEENECLSCDVLEPRTPLQELKKDILKFSILPPSWFYVDKQDGLEFMRIDVSTKRILNQLRVNEDTSITVILSNNDELVLNEKIYSYSNIHDYLKSVELWPICVGTQLNNNKYSRTCKGVIVGDDAYKRYRANPRCKFCRILRTRIQSSKPMTIGSEETSDDEKSSPNLQLKQLKLMSHKQIDTELLNTVDHKLYNLESKLSYSDSEDNNETIQTCELPETNSSETIDDPRDINLDTNTGMKNDNSIFKLIKVKEDFNDSKDENVKLILEIDNTRQEYEEYDVIYLSDTDDISALEQLTNEVDDEKVKATVQRIFEDKPKKCKPPDNKLINYVGKYTSLIKTFRLTPEKAKEEILQRKESRNYQLSPFKCDYCYKGFLQEYTFENHMKKHSAERGPFECEYCHTRWSSKHRLYRHTTNSHLYKFCCKICPFLCYCRNRIVGHCNLHRGIKHQCQECGLVFRYQNSLLMHQRHKHNKDCVCDLCGNVYVTQNGLQSHKRMAHAKDTNEFKGPKCEKCDIHFSSKRAYDLHFLQSSRHNDATRCEYCGEKFPDKQTLKKHVRTHRATGLFCRRCKKQFNNPQSYIQHAKKIHLRDTTDKKQHSSNLRENKKEYICETCGKIFICQTILADHQNTHTGELPYVCSICDKRFAFKESCKRHEKLHSADRGRLPCKMCPKFYLTSAGLMRHIKVHAGELRHACPLCDRRFVYPCEMKAHVKYTHEKEPWPKGKNIRNKLYLTEQ